MICTGQVSLIHGKLASIQPGAIVCKALKLGRGLKARRLVIINPDVSVSDNLAGSYAHLQFFYFQFSHGVVVLGGESYGFCALDLWVSWWGCST